MSSDIVRYHEGTKHHFHQFARSLGYLDWATQPRPFRSFEGAAAFALFPSPAAPPSNEPAFPSASYDSLFGEPLAPRRVSAAALGDLLRHSLGLSAWKRYGQTSWSLRVNPSSGNLHPTEAYVVAGALSGLAGSPAVYHYAADRHVLELRCEFDAAAWEAACGGAREREIVLVALTSIHWRESWKYGERAFRYCQHDLGHAIAALALAAAMSSWSTRLVPAWPHSRLAALLGLDRSGDFVDAEPEEPGCLLAIGAGEVPDRILNADPSFVDSVTRGAWRGHASRLSEDHVQWTFIDDIAAATRDAGRVPVVRAGRALSDERDAVATMRRREGEEGAGEGARASDARALVLQRRSAVALDGRSSLARRPFLHMLSRVMANDGIPWNALWWTPRIHLALFVHRVSDVAPGLYLLPRRADALDSLRVACARDFLWEPVDRDVPLVCLARGDCRPLAQRLSCDQEIAAEGFFSLGMLAEFDASLAEHGDAFYRHLFWEAGFIGQLLYLEAEAAGARATGIGCFYDDPVHDTLGLQGHAYQSLYHFTVGIPVEDTRLTTAPGYGWT